MGHGRHDWLPFHTPGHLQGRAPAPGLEALLSPALMRDLTELDETDVLGAPTGPIHEAQLLAARAWGAEHTYFLVNGSTVGLQAMIMAALRPGEAIALSRASHLAALGAVVLAGGQPVFTGPGWDPTWELPAPVQPPPEGVRTVLATRPDYYGHAMSLEPLRRWAREVDGLLLVDEAHGAHLGATPGLPGSALAQGAHGVVQSTHKTAGALTQASMLHLGPGRLEPARVRRMLRLLQTTSPSFLLLGSLDAARGAREQGEAPWAATVELAALARRRLADLDLPCLGAEYGPPGEWDPTRLVIDLGPSQRDGLAVADHLHERHAIAVELATPRYLGLILAPGHRPPDLDRLVAAMASALRVVGPGRAPLPPLPPAPALVLLPRDALLGPSRAVPLAAARGEVSSEFICPYPPGIPLVVPGERLDLEVLEYLEALRARGVTWVGPDDPTLETLHVCTSTPSSVAPGGSSS